MPTRILIIEDDEFIREGLSVLLKKEEYDVDTAESIAKAELCLQNTKYNLITLDNLLPDGTGMDFCIKLRKSGLEVPILFLTACDDEIQIVQGLDAGADDYVTKPFRLRELLSRIKALLRRNSSAAVLSRDILVDYANMTIRRNGENIFITPTEFQILSMLMKNSGVIVTRDTLLRNIWDNDESFIDDNTLSVHISRLREKIGAERIVTVRGIGYRWEE